MREGVLRRGALVAVAGAAAALAVFSLAPGAAAQSSCGWTVEISGAQANVAFPDQAARYWTAQLPIPPGFHLEVDGQFPHARYISYITYDPATRAIDGIHDTQIAPDPGSTNPFLAGADRTAANRSYKVYVVDGPAPSGGRAPNTVYTDNGQSPPAQKTAPHTAFLIYRVYEADQGLDESGGVGLPTINLVSDDGTQRQTVPNCPDHSLPSTQSLTDGLAGAGSGPGNDSIPSTELGGQNPPTWIRYTNAVDGVANGVLNNPRTGAAWPGAQQTTNLLPSGGFYENVDTAYMTAFDSAAYGDILIFHGKAPTTPQTFLPADTVMGLGQLRYWSMCSNMSSTQYLGCVKDDDVRLDAQGYYTIVISTAANRPATANPSCGIEWLPKGPLPSAPMILRDMLPDPTFTQAVQDVPPGSNTEQQVLGPYYPVGYYFDHAANFDQFVAAHGGCSGFSWPYASPPATYQPPGLPGVG
ncbi:MAG TPA: hypothetical protein VMU90_03875 [Solirubrobacteraceae bacterium]|nr:hypothetical protein [Solirubrobacteraceae bacterium]